VASIGDLYFTLRAALGGEFEADLTKSGNAAADKAGQTLGQRLSGSMGMAVKAGGVALGATLGAAFGMALSGAKELDAATRQLQADTGMTAEEAKTAGHALAGLYKDNLQGFDQIGEAMAKVHNDLGLTGEAADKATAKFLKFATATKQEAADAVASFDDILDAWNLTATDAGPLMDKLIAGHQKFGGSVSESQAALAAMAPAMTAANMTVDDGIALLNLFNAAGIDASKAPAALAKAVKQLKPGEDLNDLIAQISAIEDPTLRGQKAMELFGAKGGIGMATALRPGMGALSDYAISADEAAGKTDEAAASIEEGWGNKFTLLMKRAGGTLAEFGTKFGPLLMVASAFGPQMTRAIGAGLGGLTGILIPKVVAAVAATGIPAAAAGTRVGAMIGAAMGAAVPVAIAAGAAAIGLAIGGAIGMAIEGPVVEKAKADMAKSVGSALANAVTPADLEHMRQVILDGLEKMPTLLGWDIFGGKDALQKQLDEVDAEIARRAAGLPATVGEALTQGAPKVLAASSALGWNVLDGVSPVIAGAEKIGADIPVALAAGVRLTATVDQLAADEVVAMFGLTLGGVVAAAFSTGADGMLAMAEGIASARAKPLDAFGTLTEMLKHQMSATQEAARLAGQLTSTELAAGLRSKDPEVRAQALAVKEAILARLGELQTAKGIGSKAMDELNAGIKSKDPEIRAAAQAAKDHVIEELNKAKAPAATAGENVGQAFGAALAARVKAAIAGMVGQSPAPIAVPKAMGGPVYAGVPYIVGEYRPELFVPDVNGRILPEVPAERGGTTIYVGPIYNPTSEPASTSTKRQLRLLAAFGTLS
jgi:hypothetical protein